MSTVMATHSGPRRIITDHIETLTLRTGAEGRRDRVKGLVVEYLLPLAPAALVWWQDVRVFGVGELLAGASVLTGLLFGLLVLVWTKGIDLRREGKWKSTDLVVTMVDDLRANVTYASLVALVLVAVLAVTAAVTGAPEPVVVDAAGAPVGPEPAPAGAPLVVSIVMTWLAGHLLLVLASVLQRLRSAYLELTT